jgi:hypothetical protein
MITKYKVIYYVSSDSHTSGGYFTPKEFETRSEAADFAQTQVDLDPEHKPMIFEQNYREEGDPKPVCEGCQGDLGDSNSDYCSDCCEHQFDWDEGYTCLNCGEQGDIGGFIDALEYFYEDR